jgi:TetR/AcrR family transcriptional repressor of nem operon
MDVKAIQTPAKAPESTRRRILAAAFAEFYKNGFQGGSLNHIVATAGATKGALFHHFAGKQELGYAVVDEIITPLLMER